MKSIKALRLLLSLFLFSFFLSHFPTSGFAAIDPGLVQGNIDDIAKTVLTYFPKVTGKVVSVDGEEVVVDLGKEKGIAKGALLTVYREKEPFYHPVTRVQLGRFEEEAGTIEVEQIEENQLKARKMTPEESILPGDGVRISSARIPVGVTSLSPDGPGFLITELISALSETGRFRIDSLPPQATVRDALNRKDLYLIRLTISKEEDHFVVKLEIQNAQTGHPLSEMAVQIVQSDESDLILEHLQYQLFERRQNQTK